MKSLCAGNFCFFCFLFTCFYFVSYFLFFLCFLCCQIFSLKNWNYLDSLIYYTTDMYPPQKPYGEFFSTHLVSIFYHTYIFYLHLFFICLNLFSSARISFYLIEPTSISVHLILFVRIFHGYLWESLLFMIICENLFFESLWKQASIYIPSSKTNHLSSKHDNNILLISYVPVFCFLLYILLILCLIIFLLRKVPSYSFKTIAIFTPFAVLDSLPLFKGVQCIFDFNPTNSLIEISLYSSFILPTTISFWLSLKLRVLTKIANIKQMFVFKIFFMNIF